MEIIKQRANANKTLGRTLKAIQTAADIRLVLIDGGKKDNAIPRAAQAVFVVEAEAKDTVKQAVQTLHHGGPDQAVRLLLLSTAFLVLLLRPRKQQREKETLVSLNVKLTD